MIVRKNKITITSIFIVIFCGYIIYNYDILARNDVIETTIRPCMCLSTSSIVKHYFANSGSTFTCPMTINSQGRLGNVMGEYASLFGLSQLNGLTAYQREEMHIELTKYFNPSMPILQSYILKRITWKQIRVHDWMTQDYTNFSCNFIEITGYPCSWTFYHHMRDKIIEEFRFHNEILNDAQNQLRELKNQKKDKNVTFIGVHVRRGDYIELMLSDYNGVLADSDFFKKAMAYYRRQFENCVFVVCSEDLNWCKKNIDNSLGDVHFCWNGKSSSPGRDMGLLTQCNHTIFTMGTFGFWTAYLTGGQVIYMNNYTRNGSIYHDFFKYEAAYLPEWIPINANLSSTTWV